MRQRSLRDPGLLPTPSPRGAAAAGRGEGKPTPHPRGSKPASPWPQPGQRGAARPPVPEAQNARRLCATHRCHQTGQGHGCVSVIGKPQEQITLPPSPLPSWGSISTSGSGQPFLQEPFSARGLGLARFRVPRGPRGQEGQAEACMLIPAPSPHLDPSQPSPLCSPLQGSWPWAHQPSQTGSPRHPVSFTTKIASRLQASPPQP